MQDDNNTTPTVERISDAAKCEEFNFDDWRNLYERDPQAFERRRAQVIEEAINAAPEHQRRRLRGLVFEIEARRRSARSPMDSCIQISNLMWDKFEELRLHLNAVASPEDLSDAERQKLETPKAPAKVLQFPGRG